MELFKLFGTIAIDNQEANRALNETSKTGEKTQSKLGSAFSKVGSAAVKVGKTVAVGMVAAGTAVAALTTKAIQSYADYEQLVGGVDTLFGNSSAKVQQYAKNAYKTAGMSANEYMETVTGFSASLLQSLGNDTDAAAEKANLALTDMSDNANKMGSDMESIKNAYAGFAKQNYTMLDNLKLGYGGTKEEMERLLQDAEKFSGVKYDISSYADVVDAIHVIQTEMDITGTTAKEAASTISGSISSMKASWQNLLTAISADDLPFDDYVNAFTESVSNVVENLLPRIGIALNGIVQLVEKLAPIIISKVPALFSQLLPAIISAATGLINAIVSAFPGIVSAIMGVIPALIDAIVQIFNAIVTALPQLMQTIISALPALVPALVGGITQMIVTLAAMLPQIIQPIIENLPMIIESIVTALLQNMPLLLEAGVQLLMGLLQGMLSLISSIPDILGIIFDAIINGIKSLFGIHSPSTVMMEIGKNIILGLINGIKSLISKVSELWNNIKETTTKVFNSIKTVVTTVWNSIKTAITTVINAIKSVVSSVWNSIKDTISSVLNSILSVVSSIWNGIKNTVSNIMNGIKSTISNAWNAVKSTVSGAINSVKSTISSGLNAAKSTVSSVLEGIKSKFSSIMNGAASIVSGAINKIKGFFNFSWSLPPLKLPHFSISGKFSLNPPSIPHFGVSWYKKAMDNAMILDKPTVFGYSAASGKYLGGGEAGNEVVAGSSTLMTMIQSAVAEQNSALTYYMQKLIDILATYFPQVLESMDRDVVLDSGMLVGELAVPMDKQLGIIRDRKGRGR